jgi:hypothetical protein
MNVLGAHDYPELTTRPSVPNLKAFRRIIAGFMIAMAICFTVIISIIIKRAHMPHPVAHALSQGCACKCHRNALRNLQ